MIDIRTEVEMLALEQALDMATPIDREFVDAMTFEEARMEEDEEQVFGIRVFGGNEPDLLMWFSDNEDSRYEMN